MQKAVAWPYTCVSGYVCRQIDVWKYGRRRQPLHFSCQLWIYTANLEIH